MSARHLHTRFVVDFFGGHHLNIVTFPLPLGGVLEFLFHLQLQSLLLYALCSVK